MQLLSNKFNIINLIKDREIKIKFKEDYNDSVSIWKFQKRIDKFKEEFLDIKPANGKKTEEYNLMLKSKVNSEVIK